MVVTASKVLTVSYGTFSCTLEGFDEPFGMMKVIAEYFRDLAAEDRYFGAIPPQPDGAILQRLALDNAPGRVDARVDGTSLTLRAHPPKTATPEPPTPEFDTPAPCTAEQNIMGAAQMPTVEASPAQTPTAEASPAEPSPQMTDDATDDALKIPMHAPDAPTSPAPFPLTSPLMSGNMAHRLNALRQERATVPPEGPTVEGPNDTDAFDDLADDSPPIEDIAAASPPSLPDMPEPETTAQDDAPDSAEVAEATLSDDDVATLSPILSADEPLLAELEDVIVDPDVNADDLTAPTATEQTEDNLRRLFDATEEQLNGTDNQRRISAIAQLRAAVAATIGDHLSLGRRKKENPEHVENTTETDVEKAVPVVDAPQETPQTAAPDAPLMLIPAQRVDSPAAETSEVHPLHPITPPAKAPDQTTALPGEFARFLRSYGSDGLDDILEAAAAYTALIEGRDHFSPPELMSKLASISEDSDFTPEERLRVFGRLLRQGKIAKIKPGQYTITEASRYYQKRA